MGSSKSLNEFVFVIFFSIIIVENSKANYCLHQLINIGGLNINFNSTEAFEYIYHEFDISTRVIQGPYRNILRQYIHDLFSAAISIYNDNMLQRPMVWCNDYLSGFDRNLLKLQIERICAKMMKQDGFDIRYDAMTSLRHGYLNLIPTRRMNEMSRKYYEYIVKTFSKFIDRSNALGPKEYCENNTDCIDQITEDNGIDIQFSGKQAFQYAYEDMNSYTTKGAKKVILRQYIKYLFDEAIQIYTDDVFQSPMKWCLDNISKFKKKIIQSKRESKCAELLRNKIVFKLNNKKSLFTYAYFNITTKTKGNDVVKGYYKYLINTFLQVLNDADILGPKEYCSSLNSSLNYMSAIDLNTYLVSTQISSNQQQSDDFDDEFLQQNRDLNRSLEFTLASSSFSPTQSFINNLNQNQIDYLNALEQDLLNNPNQEHYNQQENTPNVNYDITSVNHYEPGFINPVTSSMFRVHHNQTDYSSTRGQDHYNNFNIGNYPIHGNIYPDGNTSASFNQYQPGSVPSWNYNTNLEPTSSAGTLNPNTSDHLGIESYHPDI